VNDNKTTGQPTTQTSCEKCGNSEAIISVRKVIKCPDDGRRVKLKQRNGEKDFDR
jgi:DNA-directed RNA polymerase subunit RPC12/RpoP